MLFQEKQKSSQIKIHKSLEKQFIEITLVNNFIINALIIQEKKLNLRFVVNGKINQNKH